MPYNVIDFNEGGGSYDTSTYRYTFSVAGTYFIGESHTKGNTSGAGVVDFILIRNDITGLINRIQETEYGFLGATMKSCLVFKFEVGDILFCRSAFGNPRMNNTTYTTNDIYNSFWGIRLDY